MEYHVAKTGGLHGKGSAEDPFLCIQQAADIAMPGDCVIVHKGVYREWVRPANGGQSEGKRITYMAAPGEHVEITGAEVVSGWAATADKGVYSAVVKNSLFGDYNPYTTKLGGDWWCGPFAYDVHTGDVYINGVSAYEAASMEDLLSDEMRTEYINDPCCKGSLLPHPEKTLYRWVATVDDEKTTFYVNFRDIDPNQSIISINVRPHVFYPVKTGLDFITVKGFELSCAATWYAPPTGDQCGLIGPHWAKKWIIEDCDIHDSKTSAVSLGKEISTGDNLCTRTNRKPGYTYQMEAVFKARNIGWSKERIGSHIVRNNKIHDCGQNGVVGHMGCVFSEVYNNEIYNIAQKDEWYGYEVAAIKFHVAIDVQIHDNYIHDCSRGSWMDWQAQGTHIYRNIYENNLEDIMVEVSHGPYLIENNILTSKKAIENASQGGAFVHNLILGGMIWWNSPDRGTPYHLPHSTEVLGVVPVYKCDDRFYQNIFVKPDDSKVYVPGGLPDFIGTACYNGSPASFDEYIERLKAEGHGDLERFHKVPQAAYINNNVYLNGAGHYDREENYFEGTTVEPEIIHKEDGLYLKITIPEGAFSKLRTEQIGTHNLEMTRLSEEQYENPDGSPLVIDTDLLHAAIGTSPVPGPIQRLKEGENLIKIR